METGRLSWDRRPCYWFCAPRMIWQWELVSGIHLVQWIEVLRQSLSVHKAGIGYCPQQ